MHLLLVADGYKKIKMPVCAKINELNDKGMYAGNRVCYNTEDVSN